MTIVKEHHLSQERLIEQVQKELHAHCGISDCSFLKQYKIPKALPDLDNVKYDISVAETQYSPQIFLAGDTLLNGSLNAAILAGERAALGVINAIKAV